MRSALTGLGGRYLCDVYLDKEKGGDTYLFLCVWLQPAPPARLLLRPRVHLPGSLVSGRDYERAPRPPRGLLGVVVQPVGPASFSAGAPAAGLLGLQRGWAGLVPERGTCRSRGGLGAQDLQTDAQRVLPSEGSAFPPEEEEMPILQVSWSLPSRPGEISPTHLIFRLGKGGQYNTYSMLALGQTCITLLPVSFLNNCLSITCRV
ncbi:uncharacterized protein LOC123391019 [Mustela putorius furo]|uniref:Uncharacterized protein LOC123391019 n=1 Tax=Mustela putorius furo TaxID=9669 RepID=A0A8U0RY62_MUSPF|nr:uncharacterized protein LOC123391019 [Mustela putorius furo]